MNGQLLKLYQTGTGVSTHILGPFKFFGRVQGRIGTPHSVLPLAWALNAGRASAIGGRSRRPQYSRIPQAQVGAFQRKLKPLRVLALPLSGPLKIIRLSPQERPDLGQLLTINVDSGPAQNRAVLL